MRRSTYIKPSILARLMHSTLMRAAVTAAVTATGACAGSGTPVSAPLCRARVIVDGAL